MDEFNPIASTNKSTTASFANAPLIALAVAVIALALALWSLLESRDTEQTLTQNLGVKLADQSIVQKNTATQVDLMVKDLRDSQNRVAQLEGMLPALAGGCDRRADQHLQRLSARQPGLVA